MRLIVNELFTSLSQAVKPSKNTLVGAVRPHLYLHNKPTGSVKVQVCEYDGTLISESAVIAFSDITSASYFHGYVTFNVDAFLMKNTLYTIKIVTGDGYSFSEPHYAGVCNDYDLRKYTPITPVSHPNLAPLDLEIWSRSLK